MVQTIQGLVGSIRGDAPIQQINQEITSIAEVVGKVVAETEASGNAGEMVERYPLVGSDYSKPALMARP